MQKIYPLLAVVILFAAVVTACSGSTGTSETTAAATGTNETTTAEADSPAADSPAPASGATITIENMAFGQPLTVSPGSTITVANMDTAEHSVTSDTAGVFDVHVDGKAKKTLVAPSQPGEYAFHCVYHPSMKGTLIVQ
jgi:plastocyanin